MGALHAIGDEELSVLEQVIPKLAGIARSTGSNWILEDCRKARKILSAVRWPDGIWHQQEPIKDTDDTQAFRESIIAARKSE